MAGAERKRLEILTRSPAGDERAYQNLVEAGYETVDDIRDADPEVIKEIDGVGPKTLRRLTRKVDGFDATRQVIKSGHGNPLFDSKVTHCPACQEELESGKYLSHILNCEEA